MEFGRKPSLATAGLFIPVPHDVANLLVSDQPPSGWWGIDLAQVSVAKYINSRLADSRNLPEITVA